MPAVAAAAAISASTAALTAGATAVGTAAATAGGLAAAGGIAGVLSANLGGIIASAAVAGLAGAAQAALAEQNRPRPQGQIAFSQSTPAAQVVIGETRVAGPLALLKNHEGTSDQRRNVWFVMILACHEIDDVLEIWDGTELLWTKSDGLTDDYDDKIGHVSIRLGTASQTPPEDLLDQLQESLPGATGTNFRLRGLPHVILRFNNMPRRFTGGLPKLWCKVRGAKILDPRSGLTQWTNNWALGLAYYMTLLRGGCGFAQADLDTDALVASANICDEWVATKAGGSIRRYRLNGVFRADGSLQTVREILRYGAGSLAESRGKFRVIAGANYAPVATITEADFLGAPQLSGAVRVEDRVDGVVGTYGHPSNGYNADEYKPITFSSYDPAQGPPRLHEARLPFETIAERSQRLGLLEAKQLLRPNRLVVPVHPKHLAPEPGEVVTVVAPTLGINHPFEIREKRMNLTPAGPSIVLDLLETGATFWDFDPNDMDEPPAPRPSTLRTRRVMQPPANLLVQVMREIEPDGAVTRSLRCSWDASPDLRLRHYRLYWTQGGRRRSRLVDGDDTVDDIHNVAAGVATTVRVAAIGLRGLTSALIGPSDIVPLGDTTPPAAPTIASATAVIGGVRLRMQRPPERDFAHFEAWVGAAGSAFGSAVKAEEFSALDHTLRDLPLGVARRIWVRAVDRSGNVSAASAPVERTARRAQQDDQEDGSLTAAKFAAGIEPVTLVLAPPLPTVKSTTFVHYAPTGLLYRWTGTAYKAVTDAGDIQGLIDGAQVKLNTLAVKNLVVTDFDNLIPDEEIQDASLWTAAGWTHYTGDLVLRSDGAFQRANAAPYAEVVSPAFRVAPGERYYMAVEVGFDGGLSVVGPVYARVDWHRRDGSLISTVIGPAAVTSADLGAIYTAPAGARRARLRLAKDANAVAGSGALYVGGFVARLAAAGKLIVDGDIAARHMGANSVVAGKIAAGAISAASLFAGEVVTTDVIAPGATQQAFRSVLFPGAVGGYQTVATIVAERTLSFVVFDVEFRAPMASGYNFRIRNATTASDIVGPRDYWVPDYSGVTGPRSVSAQLSVSGQNGAGTYNAGHTINLQAAHAGGTDNMTRIEVLAREVKR